jgi:ABC-type multidrug transport system fused ATPase/permease subunit
MRKLNVTSARPRARFAQSSKFCKRRDFALKIKPRLMSGKTEEIKTVKSSNAAAVKAVKAAEMTMRLRVNDVTYVPPGSARQTLSSLTFSLPRNGLVLVVGRSGAGKSTLLNLIGGYESACACARACVKIVFVFVFAIYMYIYTREFPRLARRR